jgi:threonine/homoserine/homoserine lactone efflux protein
MIDMTAALLAGAALGLSVAAPFGPVSLICVQQSLNRGFWYGVVSGFGAATSHGIFATAAIVGAGTISVVLMPWSNTIRLLSALVLVWLGVRTILKARSVAKPARTITVGMAYASTLMLSLSNPMTIIPYLALATVAAEEDIGSATLSLWSVPGVMVAASTWYGCISFVTGIMRSGISPNMSRVLNLVAGGSLIVFGAVVGRRLLAL